MEEGIKVFSSEIPREYKSPANNLYDLFEMEEDRKIFSSDIPRRYSTPENNLYDLFNTVPAEPKPQDFEMEHSCDFKPKANKYYVAKKRKKLDVRTVREIRNMFEKDVYIDLPNELEKQQNILLTKITAGTSQNENTKSLAKNMLQCNKPICRSSWQMLINLNPDGHANRTQYVLWNSKLIRVNGSKGGKNKFLCNYDLAKKTRIASTRKSSLKTETNRRKGLLRNSLSVKFKPGPLSRKKYLDKSFQKYNVGDTELVYLPKPGLCIQPLYGVPLEPTVSKFLLSLRDKKGSISEKWAEFSVSVLGTVINSTAVQNNDNSNVSFDLNYTCDQCRILMRYDVGNAIGNDKVHLNTPSHPCSTYINHNNIMPEIKTIVNDILKTVEINVNQDKMYAEEEHRETLEDDYLNINSNTHVKDKVKRKYCELGRLNVTVITLPNSSRNEETTKICQNSFCSLGCICASLRHADDLRQHYGRIDRLKEHCGRIECMFECKCEIVSHESECPELMSGLINLDKQTNLGLAKEEQKFHQTVVVSGDKSILLKSARRNWKTSKRYADFYSDMCLKAELKTKKMLSVVDIRLNCENIEPWCMVHNLYKCFCRGTFTTKLDPVKLCQEPDLNVFTAQSNEKTKDEVSVNETKAIKSRYLRTRTESKSCENNLNKKYLLESVCSPSSVCARVIPYRGRKYYDSYYISTNNKILEMEKNDENLHKKMMDIISNIEMMESMGIDKNKLARDNCLDKVECVDMEVNDKNKLQCRNDFIEDFQNPCLQPQNNPEDKLNIKLQCSSSLEVDLLPSPSIDTLSRIQSTNSENRSILSGISKLLPSRNKLISWLENSYKQYKRRVDQGLVKTSLDPPRHGKVALYPWNFIASRYNERKNLFLVSNEMPFRIFMAVDTKNALFDNCINIDDIRFADLHKYPVTVKNLLTNSTNLKDNFCILCGLSQCWELVGSVTKVGDQTLSKTKQTTERQESFEKERNNATESFQIYDTDKPTSSGITYVNKTQDNNVSKDVKIDIHEILEGVNETDDSSDLSKWFVMTVENDFTEIQFYSRGFFVKYESIIKAINVAIVSGKSVRLSAQKSTDPNAVPQFGIYAIPKSSEYCVFVGPYDKEESLGIETVKSRSDIRRKKNTRGFWITTKKVDNVKVIDNPLSFMPKNIAEVNKILSLEVESGLNDPENKADVENSLNTSVIFKNTNKKNQIKVVKPIKIRKTDGFYHLQPSFIKQSLQPEPQKLPTLAPASSRSLLQRVVYPNLQHQETQNPIIINATPLLLNDSLLNKNVTNHHVPIMNLLSTIQPSLSLLKKAPSVEGKEVLPHNSLTKTRKLKPVAENAPQVNKVGINSERGMFVLKPEEINKRSMIKQEHPVTETSNKNIVLDADIENFLVNSAVCSPPNADIFVISDEEGNDIDGIITNDTVIDVRIECKNVENLGWIRGRKNADNDLSFEFPGFKYTEYYREDEAFSKINQVLSRKVYVPKSVTLEWEVIESKDQPTAKSMLTSDELGTDFVLTKRGLRHRSAVMANGSVPHTATATSSSAIQGRSTFTTDEVDKASELLSELEKQSDTLEDESDMLLCEITKRGEIMRSFANVFDIKGEKMETLQNIASASNDEEER